MSLLSTPGQDTERHMRVKDCHGMSRTQRKMERHGQENRDRKIRKYNKTDSDGERM